jgi:hypothetical protein
LYNKEEHFVVESIEIRGKRNIKIGKFYCVLNDKTYSTLGGIRNAIRPFNYTVKDFYDSFYKLESEGFCTHCGNQCSFDNLLNGYKKFCSDICFNKDPSKREKISNRFVSQPEKYNSYLEKRKFNWNNRSDDQIEQHKENCRVGKTKTAFDIKSKNGKIGAAKLNKMCLEDPNKRLSMTEKMLQTKIRNNSFANGISGKIKTIIYKDINFMCQGYEDLVIKYLIDNNILFYNRELCPQINITSNKSGKYCADIYLPEYNLLIDVKSEYTMPVDDKNILHFLERQNASFDQGYNFLIFAIHGKTVKKDRILCEDDRNIFYNFLTTLISSQVSNRERFNDYPVIRSTLQAIGSGNAGKPIKL